jgi:hypothetical protein
MQSDLLHFLTYSKWPFKSHVSAVDRPLFNLNTHCGTMFSILDKNDTHLMVQCFPICPLKVNGWSHTCCILLGFQEVVPSMHNQRRGRSSFHQVWCGACSCTSLPSLVPFGNICHHLHTHLQEFQVLPYHQLMQLSQKSIVTPSTKHKMITCTSAVI